MVAVAQAPKRAAIYCRVSSVDREKNCSLATQEASCRRFATAQGWTIFAVESEQHSGAALVDREGLQRVLGMIEAGEADVLLAHASDRLSREQLHIGVILDRVLRAGASLQFATEDFENSPVGKFLLSARTFAAELELAKIGERTQRGRRARVAARKPLAGRKPPFGYRWLDPEKKKGGKTRLVTNPDEAPAVRLVFDLALQGLPLRRISDVLAAKGIPSPAGAPRWQPSSIRDVLLRPVYSGSLVTYATKREPLPGGGYRQRPATADEWVVLPGVAEPIVTPEEQAAVTRRLELNKLHSTRRNMHPEAALLRGGHLVCGHCGWTLSVSNATPASRSLSPQYRCTAQRQHGPSCPRPSISASLIDGAVWAKVCEVLRDPAIIAAQVAKHREDGGLERQLATVERAGATITEKQARTAKAISLIADDEAAAPLLTELQALAAAKRAAQSEHDALQRRIADQAAERARMTSLSEWCGTVAANLDTLSYDEKRLALAALGVRVQAYRLGTSDAEGTPYPRWELTMAPVSPDPSIVYESTR